MEDYTTKQEKTQLPEAPISITIKGYYKGFSVLLTKRLDDDQLSKYIDGVTAIIQQMDERGFKPSWNEETNGKYENGKSKFTQEVNEPIIRCSRCGEPATERRGKSKTTGKPYHAIFCTTEDKSHTQWL